MKLDWITDPHLDHLSGEALCSFAEQLHNRDSDGLLITGDIAESRTIYDFLGLISGAYQRPVYFVLGNHDLYGAWRAVTYEIVRDVCAAVPPGILNWMTDLEGIRLSENTLLIGHDGFYDGQCGLGRKTDMAMTDFTRRGIPDLTFALTRGPDALFDLLLEWGRESASVLEQRIRLQANQVSQIWVLTHVPPFHEASYFRGKPSNGRSAPYYVNKSLGDMLMRVSEDFPDVKFRVFAGHTHGKREYLARPNLEVSVGQARYSTIPRFQRIEV